MARRKYRFRSREEAEQKYQERDREHLTQLRLARALYQGKVNWVCKAKPYRAGVFDTDGHISRAVFVFEPGGQEPDLQVWDDPEVLRSLETSCVYRNDSETEAMLKCLTAIRKEMGW